MILLTVDCLPVSWKSHAGYGKKSFNPRFKEKEFYQWQIKTQWNQELISSPISLEFSFHLPIPSGTPKAKKLQMLNGVFYHVKRPDITNLTKFAEDCLKGVVIEDDSQVVKLSCEKIYALAPKTVIKVFPI